MVTSFKDWINENSLEVEDELMGYAEEHVENFPDEPIDLVRIQDAMEVSDTKFNKALKNLVKQGYLTKDSDGDYWINTEEISESEKLSDNPIYLFACELEKWYKKHKKDIKKVDKIEDPEDSDSFTQLKDAVQANKVDRLEYYINSNTSANKIEELCKKYDLRTLLKFPVDSRWKFVITKHDYKY